MLSPFDPRSLFLAKHAQHVVLIHFPIALFLTGFLCDVLAVWKRKSSLRAVAQFNVLAASVAVIPTVLTGLIAWRWELEGRRLHGVLLLHLVFALVAACLVLGSGFLHWREHKKPQHEEKWLRLLLEFTAAAAIVLAAHLGGFVSGVNSTF
jgi:uncharacterized membrane protein